MKLSVIIVNYNVRAYLEQCLRTVFTALESLEGEVFVVDNLSTDGSVEMVREKFPQVKLIANQENVGFSRANNQAIRIAKGDHVLLLNPDTVVGEDVFRKVVAFMDAHPKVGGLGVKMIDGTGRFLPESKRGLPTPQVAFFKIIGLTRFFPRSRVFGRYHLGHLPENEAAPIEILSGACMFLRRKTLDEVGLLDESFFMYGEDIDLSYRITLGGYENWYFPDARIIHYKGESTKKSSVNYVFVFYNAMAIFAQKHFTRRHAGIFPLLITGSIYLSAAAAIAARFLSRALLPVLDLLLVILILALSPVVPQRWPIIQELGADLAIGATVLGWMALFGAYDRPLRFAPPLLALTALVALTGLVGLAGWSGWDELADLALLCFYGAMGAISTRVILHLLRVRGHGLRRKERERVLAIGSAEESHHALALLWQTHFGLGRTITVQPGSPEAEPSKLARSITRERIGEVVFCAKDMPWGTIIERMEQLRDGGAEFKIAQPAREFIIGPSSIESLQDLFILQEHAIHDPAARRSKRIMDVLTSVLLFLLFPVLAIFIREPLGALSNAWQVLWGNRTWVGYQSPLPSDVKLPALPPAVLGPMDAWRPVPTQRMIDRVNILYAKDHCLSNDLGVLMRGFRSLGSVRSASTS